MYGRNDQVYCSDGEVCDNKNSAAKREVEESEWDSWVCKECLNEKIGIELIDFIRDRIKVTESEDEDRGKFIFREIIQNADDVGADKLVLRFEEDALYIANDGRGFTTSHRNGKKSDWDRVSEVLKMHQADDKETTGHFGSGFQTVYAVTNQPEIHSNGNSRAMNPIDKKWIDDIDSRKSPYIGGEGSNKGVLFRFPWRDNESAEEEFEGAFSDKETWPRWEKPDRKELFDIFRNYLHDSILCCQNIKNVRLIWAEDGETKAYQSTRDFQLDGEDDEKSSYVGKVKTGRITPSKEMDFNESFKKDVWSFKESETQEISYYICYRKARNEDGEIAHIWKKGGGEGYVITGESDEDFDPSKEVKKNDCYLLLPMSNLDATNIKETYFLYSVIPLPKRGKNGFAFTAHFFPEQSRKDVKVDGKFGEWYRLLMDNIAKLYIEHFNPYLEELKGRIDREEIDDLDAQKILLNVLPRKKLSEWMRPGRAEDWTPGHYESIVENVIEQKILYTNDKWIQPVEGYWGDETEREIVDKLGGNSITRVFWENSPQKVKDSLERSNIFTKDTLIDLWKDFKESNETEGVLTYNKTYNKKLEEPKIIDKKFLEPIISYSLIEKDSKDLHKLDMVPGADGILRSIEEYPEITGKYETLSKIIADRYKIHPDFSDIFRGIEGVRKEINPEKIPEIINRTVKNYEEENKSFDEEFLEYISEILKILAEDEEFTLKEKMKEFKFIPYEYNGEIQIGRPNTYEKDNKEVLLNSQNTGGHIGENMDRNSIFAVHRCEVKGLTPEIEDKIKILKLEGLEEDEVREIENNLSLEPLASNEKTPANYVRHFLSQNHGSLFENDRLKNFLEIKDSEKIDAQKKKMQKALKVYFNKEKTETSTKITPKHMGEVPCLYDEEGEWHKSKKFAIDMTPGISLFDLKKLHEDIEEDWDEKTLLNIGVRESPDYGTIRKRILELKQSPQQNREEIASVSLYLLSSEGIKIEDIEKINEFLTSKNQHPNEELEKEFIPTLDGFSKLGDVYYPEKEIKESLGSDFHKIFDISAVDDRVREFVKNKIEGSSIESERMKKLGFLVEPDIEDLFDVLKSKIKNQEEPPKKIFSKLDETAEADDFSDSERYYYHEGEWYQYSEIVLVEGESEPIKDRYTDILEIQDSDKHPISYLKKIGVKDRIHPNLLIQRIEEGSISPKKEHWTDIYRGIKEINLKEEYGELQIFPFDLDEKEFIAPKKIIIGDKDSEGDSLPLFPENGKYLSKYYVFSGRLAEEEKKLLLELGAEREENLKPDSLIDLIKSINSIEIDLNQIESILMCLRRIGALDNLNNKPWSSSSVLKGLNERIWPVRIGDKFRLEYPDRAYLNDSNKAKRFYEVIPIAITKIEGQTDEKLEEIALKSGVKSFKEELDSHVIEDGDVERDYEAEEYFKQISKNISEAYPELNEEEVLGSIENITVKSVTGDLRIEYEIGGKKDTESLEGGLITKQDEDITWYISYPLSRNNLQEISRDLTSALLNQAQLDLNPGEKQTELEYLIYRMMDRPCDEWSEINSDFNYEGPKSYSPGGPLQIIHDIEGSMKGYRETLDSLKSYYGFCQICGSITPKSENAEETCEKIKKIISKRGGRLKPPKRFEDGYRKYETGNALFLCPRHHALYERGLIKFESWDSGDIREDNVDEIRKRLKEFKNSINPEKLSIPMKVYENQEDGRRLQRPKWIKKEIEFKKEHYEKFLQTIRDYFEQMLDLKGG
ncbi:sacsin N-terminal ATP-binding-like domain-containing protein [Methanonatronarchaeum sp. AMET6-2]|uniref:sacsin N-terminal ATP-binding-like domain-containing protein n=1 Tax=Methanonatronarchaeum sp. AMET6-2 TaxID=2933293 RepID=UPI001FF547F1|nr:hypothetical protein [Methanonatronarchaeum sp. AMET6-2]UOY10007.1 hypothetical protein MU439_07040 [Methanonatronarchaeum sp. AMET6-2]